MTQTLKDLRHLVAPAPKPKPVQKRPHSGPKERQKPNRESRYSLEAVLEVVPPGARNAARWAMSTFPAVFPVQPNKIRPLAVGIASELQARIKESSAELTGEEFSRFMTWWCRRGAYLRATASGGKRINLSGELGAELTDKDIGHARKLLEQRTKRPEPSPVTEAGTNSGE